MVMIKQRFISIVALCAVFALTGPHKGGADEVADNQMAWLGEDYPYLIVDQALPDALVELGHNLDIAVEISSAVRGRVRRYEHAGSSGDFLDTLASEHGFDWVFDQGRLFISSSTEKINRSWSAGSDIFEAARAALSDADIDDPRYPVGFDSGRGELNLSAPPRYVAMVAPVIDRMLTPKAAQAVNVIHGRNRAGGT